MAQRIKQLKSGNQQIREKNAFTAHVGLLHRGMMIGDDDMIDLKNYSKSCKVISLKATVFWINANDFFQRVKIF